MQLACCSAIGQPAQRDIREATIAQLHQAMTEGSLTAVNLVDHYLARIESYDQASGLNSIVVVNPKARERARQLDDEFQKTGTLRPLHGIPVVVKDNYDTHDLQTAAGSLALQGSLPPDDAFQVRRLREAGAIVLAKTNMAEWAYSPLFTVSSIAGVTRNPYDLLRVPAGSSGGTAAAVAANLAAVGLGTDTGNSIRGPASHCGLVGIRPTLGLTSRDGIVPLFLRNDTGGPMCRTVEDVARVLDVIVGEDPADPITEQGTVHIPKSYTDSLVADGLRGARIGVLRMLSDTPTRDAQVKQLFDRAIQDLRAAGAIVYDPFAIPDLTMIELEQMQRKLWKDTFRHDIDQYLASLGPAAPIHDFMDIVQSGKYHVSVQQRLAASQRAAKPDLEKPYSADPVDDPLRWRLREIVLAGMARRKVDVFVYPTWNNPPRMIDDLQSPDGNNSYFIPPHTGQPAITVPMGYTHGGLPAGLQMVARPFDEPTLIRLAYSYEQATRHRRAPPGFGALGD